MHCQALQLQGLVLVMAGLSLSGCSIISPAPLWELAKATGSLASMAVATAPGESSNTVYHAHEPLKELCIEFNPQAQVADIVPALQIALRQHQIESRSHYELDPVLGTSKWASTQDKLTPVVSALITGIENKPASTPTSQKEKT